MGDKEGEMGTLIILHGWSYSTDKWEPFLKALKEKGVEYKMPKIPGLTAPLGNVWTLDDYVFWLEKQTADSKKPITILGHSNGGRIAAAFAAKFPEKVSHLVLIDSAGIIRKNLKTMLKKRLFDAIAKLGKRVTNLDSIRNLFYKAVGEQDYNKANPILKKTMLNLISQDLTPVFSKLTTPTLIVWGDNDKVTPISDGRKIHGLISGSKFEIIKNARHSPQFTNSKKIADLVTQFIK